MTIHNIAQLLECYNLMTSFNSFGDVPNLIAVTQCTDFRIGVIFSNMIFVVLAHFLYTNCKLDEVFEGGRDMDVNY